MFPAAIIVGLIASIALMPRFFRGVLAGGEAQEVERQLLRRCMGDESKVSRLIEYEIRRRPKLSRTEAAAPALESLVRDNR
jgi:hypothetical protein